MAQATLTDTLRLLITANHVLHHNGVVDAFGHVSARNPLNNDTFYMAARLAPAVVSSPADLVEYNVADGSPVDPNALEGYKERFIHSEILRHYPAVNSVVHSHADDVLPFTLVANEDGSAYLQPSFHMAGFLGDDIPIFDIEDAYTPAANDTHDLLISSTRLGNALASHFGVDDEKGGPAKTVVLMRGHGFTTLGPAIQTAVYRAHYTAANAKTQKAALEVAALAGGGDRSKPRVKYLTTQERRHAGESNLDWQVKAWNLWVRQVATAPGGLYQNSLGYPDVFVG